jgi:hypothetical protein
MTCEFFGRGPPVPTSDECSATEAVMAPPAGQKSVSVNQLVSAAGSTVELEPAPVSAASSRPPIEVMLVAGA